MLQFVAAKAQQDLFQLQTSISFSDSGIIERVKSGNDRGWRMESSSQENELI
ncbi:hypothetical protein DPMN_008789 [Dreissena polymorpha]|uniref:Uncharacterized protein n=1 Tax=Dreissena polymorpha TaxID=45954 RepID=A0A9D4RXP1_DREPO|nr:hypothetical protein DPMN_008789 [Dreissena polymorpha]